MKTKFQYICNNPRSIDVERNDCVVRALSLAFNRDYMDVHKVCATAGRKPQKGMTRDKTEKALKQLSNKTDASLIKLARGKRQTLATFARDNNKGNWLVIKRGHAVALIDGVYHDSSSQGFIESGISDLPRSIVQCYYKVK